MHGARCGDHIPCGGGYQQWSDVDRIVSVHFVYACYKTNNISSSQYHLLIPIPFHLHILPSSPLLPRQLVGLVLVLLAQSLQTPLSLDLVPNNQCSTDSTTSSSFHSCSANTTSSVLAADTPPQDLTYVELFNSCFSFVIFAIFLFLFWPKYKRLDSEMAAEKLAKLKASQNAEGVSVPTKPDIMTSI